MIEVYCFTSCKKNNTNDFDVAFLSLIPAAARRRSCDSSVIIFKRWPQFDRRTITWRKGQVVPIAVDPFDKITILLSLWGLCDSASSKLMGINWCWPIGMCVSHGTLGQHYLFSNKVTACGELLHECWSTMDHPWHLWFLMLLLCESEIPILCGAIDNACFILGAEDGLGYKLSHAYCVQTALAVDFPFGDMSADWLMTDECRLTDWLWLFLRPRPHPFVGDLALMCPVFC